MLEPQSTGLFILLMVIFAVLAWWMMTARHVAFRIFAACLAFVPAMLFGVLAVNKYYGYYQTWDSAAADFTNQTPAGVQQASNGTKLASGPAVGMIAGNSYVVKVAQQQGDTLQLTVAGQRSQISRTVFVYLPPQYFQASYRSYRFPVIELLHGQPGEPQDWINVVGVTQSLEDLLSRNLARPAVLVMPDVNGARSVSLQCLNQAGGPQDMTYLAEDVPDSIAQLLRVQEPGQAWAVAGYSEGGYCAANMALRFPLRYGFSGVMSGYFAPMANRLHGRPVSPFGGNIQLEVLNTPLDTVEDLPAHTAMPHFWIGAGMANREDVRNAKQFEQELRFRHLHAPLTLTRGGGHSMMTWRDETPQMLEWLTPRLAKAAQEESAAQAKRELALAAAHKGRSQDGASARPLVPAIPPDRHRAA